MSRAGNVGSVGGVLSEGAELDSTRLVGGEPRSGPVDSIRSSGRVTFDLSHGQLGQHGLGSERRQLTPELREGAGRQESLPALSARSGNSDQPRSTRLFSSERLEPLSSDDENFQPDIGNSDDEVDSFSEIEDREANIDTFYRIFHLH